MCEPFSSSDFAPSRNLPSASAVAVNSYINNCFKPLVLGYDGVARVSCQFDADLRTASTTITLLSLDNLVVVSQNLINNSGFTVEAPGGFSKSGIVDFDDLLHTVAQQLKCAK